MHNPRSLQERTQHLLHTCIGESGLCLSLSLSEACCTIMKHAVPSCIILFLGLQHRFQWKVLQILLSVFVSRGWFSPETWQSRRLCRTPLPAYNLRLSKPFKPDRYLASPSRVDRPCKCQQGRNLKTCPPPPGKILSTGKIAQMTLCNQNETVLPVS